MTEISKHLRGPWVAVMSDRYGEIYPDVETARVNGLDEVEIAVVRGTAAPQDGVSLPGSYSSGDVAYELTDVWVDDDGDPSVAAEARWTQARAMAAGLNAAAPVGELVVNGSDRG